MGGHCQYFTVKRSHPRAKGRRRLLFTRWELSRGHPSPTGHTEAHSHSLGNWPDLLIQYFPVHQHILFFSLIGRMCRLQHFSQSVAATRAARWAEEAVPAPTAAAGAAAVETPGMQTGCTPLLCPTHSDRNKVLRRDRQQQLASSARDTAQDSFRSFSTTNSVLKPACVLLQAMP